jgi:hypothetical protein
MLQQVRRIQRRLKTILSRDSTGKTHLTDLVERFLADQNADEGMFLRAERDFDRIYSVAESAREALRQVAIDDNYNLADSVCQSIRQHQKHCGELWMIVVIDGREKLASAYEASHLFFQTFRS